MVRLTDRPDVTLDVYRGRKTQHYNNNTISVNSSIMAVRCILFFSSLYTEICGVFFIYIFATVLTLISTLWHQIWVCNDCL